MEEQSSRHRTFGRPAVDELKRKSVRGGVVAVGAQGVKLVLQTGTVMLLARLLSPQDFGLAGMAGTLTGFLALFRDAGLASATIQSREVDHEQLSTLFWINAAIGAGLAALAIALAPALAWFYREPRVFWVAAVFGVVVPVHGADGPARGADHPRDALCDPGEDRFDVSRYKLGDGRRDGVPRLALLVVRRHGGREQHRQRRRRMAGRSLGSRHSRGAIAASCRCFILADSRPSTAFSCIWRGTPTIFFLGRYWGAHALGIYGRAYQLATLPVEQWTATLSGVALSGLSAVQHDPERLSRSFLKAYSMLLSVTVPIAITCPLFADEIIRILLGAKMDGGRPDLQAACSDLAGVRVGEPAELAEHSDRQDAPRGQHDRRDDAGGHRGHPARSQPWTVGGRHGVLGAQWC